MSIHLCCKVPGSLIYTNQFEDKGMSRNLALRVHMGIISYQDIVYKFGMKNIPAFGDEEFITSINDYVIKLDFQLSKIHTLDGRNIDIITTWTL